MSARQNAAAKVREKNLFDGIRVEEPAKMAALNQPFDDALQDQLTEPVTPPTRHGQVL